MKMVNETPPYIGLKPEISIQGIELKPPPSPAAKTPTPRPDPPPYIKLGPPVHTVKPDNSPATFLHRGSVAGRKTFGMQEFALVWSDELIQPIITYGLLFPELQQIAWHVLILLEQLNRFPEPQHPSFVPTQIVGLEAQLHAHCLHGHKLLLDLPDLDSDQQLASLKVIQHQSRLRSGNKS
jgi:hypothetical protein